VTAVRSSRDFLNDVPEYNSDKDYLGAFLHGGYRITVAGPIGHGKTSFLMEAAAAAARGDEFLGQTGAGVPVLYVDLEMGPEQIGQAMRYARLPHENFHIVSRPEGLAIDRPDEAGTRDRKLLEKWASEYAVLVIDPWHKVVEQELEYSLAGRVTRYLDNLKERNPNCCMIIGFHAQEPQSPRAQINLGSISGFKVFQRNADIVVTFQRIRADSSRIMWVKSRSPRLGVKMMEKWEVDWSPGDGFRRHEAQSNPDEVYALVTDDWQTTTWLQVLWGRDRSHLLKVLSKLEIQGRIESQGSDKGGRGHEKRWRRRDPNQEVFSFAS
jgi:hypothetical protein